MSLAARRRLAEASYVAGAVVAVTVAFAVAGAAQALAGLWEDVTRDPGPVAVFADANLEQAVRHHLDKPRGAIAQADMAGLEVLHLESWEIGDLSGIEQAAGLRTVVLTDNRVHDLGPLAGMSELRCLLVAGNDVDELGPLVRLVEAGQLGAGPCGFSEYDERAEGPLVDLRFNPLDSLP